MATIWKIQENTMNYYEQAKQTIEKRMQKITVLYWRHPGFTNYVKKLLHRGNKQAAPENQLKGKLLSYRKRKPDLLF